MDLTALRIFLAVAEERSFSRAAAKVHRTQPAVSQAVKRLEDDLGEQLFDRSSKSGTLTDAGRVLQNYGQRLVRLAEETESAMRELRDLRRGRVLIGANDQIVPLTAIESFLAEDAPRDCTTIAYLGGWHLLLRDLQRERVFEDILAWMHGDPPPSGLWRPCAAGVTASARH